MKQINNEWIKLAIDAIEETKISTGNEVPDTMNAYVSSFGAATIQSGFIPAIIFFGSQKKDKAEHRPKLIAALTKMVSEKEKEWLKFNKIEIPVIKQLEKDLKELVEYLLKLNPTQLAHIQSLYNEAAIAFKLAIRTYKEKN